MNSQTIKEILSSLEIPRGYDRNELIWAILDDAIDAATTYNSQHGYTPGAFDEREAVRSAAEKYLIESRENNLRFSPKTLEQ